MCSATNPRSSMPRAYSSHPILPRYSFREFPLLVPLLVPAGPADPILVLVVGNNVLLVLGNYSIRQLYYFMTITNALNLSRNACYT